MTYIHTSKDTDPSTPSPSLQEHERTNHRHVFRAMISLLINRELRGWLELGHVMMSYRDDRGRRERGGI